MTEYTCIRCGATRLEGDEAAGHIPGDPATCTQPQLCTRCGAVIENALGHDYAEEVTEPNCTEMGYTTYTCSVCGDSYVGNYTDALEHTYTAVVTKEPTCTEEGVKTFTCSECGKSYTEAIPTVAHSYEAVVTAPTCDKMGYTCLLYTSPSPRDCS